MPKRRRKRNPQFNIDKMDANGKEYFLQLVVATSTFYSYLRLEYERSSSGARHIVQRVVENAINQEEEHVKHIA